MKIYVAGSWENRVEVRELMDDLRQMGHEIAVDWTTHESQDMATEYAKEDLAGINSCDALVYHHDGIKSGGKIYELGYAHGLGVLTVVYAVSGGVRDGCVFLRGGIHPVVTTLIGLKEALDYGRMEDRGCF